MVLLDIHDSARKAVWRRAQSHHAQRTRKVCEGGRALKWSTTAMEIRLEERLTGKAKP